MKKLAILSFAIILSLSINAQSNCKVFIKNLKGEYIGECKKGKANGTGTAIGKETYTGEWRKGYPNGEGKYTYENGDAFEGSWKRGRKHGFGKFFEKIPNGVKVKTGYWDADIYVGEEKLLAKYTTLRKSGIERIRFNYLGNAENSISFTFITEGKTKTTLPENFILNVSSGTESAYSSESKIQYQDLVFPLNLDVKFTAPTRLHTATKRCELVSEINLAGEWEVVLYY